MKLISKIKQFISYNITSDKFKCLTVVYACAIVHMLYIVLFSVLRVKPLIIFNIGSVIIYFKCAGVIKYGYKENLIKTFYVTYLEIVLHACAAIICTGWHYGFQQYIISLIPFGYYMCVTLINENKKFFIATLLGVIAFLSFIGCHIIYMFTGAVYQLNISPAMQLGIYIFNSICNFAFLFIVTLIFVMDMQVAANKLHNQNAILDNMASTDPLTGLYNRRSMQAFLNHAIESEVDCCLVMGDIDNFKKVNDTYGHDFGDVVLKDVAQIIQKQVNDNGYVCRWGGEEILILINGKLDIACKIAENIRSNVETHIFSLHEKPIHCSLTLGVAVHKKGNTIEDTITHADTRLYHGKQDGKNRVVSPYDTV